MKFRGTKAAGSFDCTKEGCFELLVTMEADPSTLSYAEFSFESELPPDQAAEFTDVPAFLLRHRIGLFVVCAESAGLDRSPMYRAAWEKLDVILARRGIWLLSTTRVELRREPQWSNVLQIARCANADITSEDLESVTSHLANVGRATLRRCMTFCESSSDSFDAILRLVVAGIIFLDPADDISPSTTVRLSPPDTMSIDWLSAQQQLHLR